MQICVSLTDRELFVVSVHLLELFTAGDDGARYLLVACNPANRHHLLHLTLWNNSIESTDILEKLDEHRDELTTGEDGGQNMETLHNQKYANRMVYVSNHDLDVLDISDQSRVIGTLMQGSRVFVHEIKTDGISEETMIAHIDIGWVHVTKAGAQCMHATSMLPRYFKEDESGNELKVGLPWRVLEDGLIVTCEKEVDSRPVMTLKQGATIDIYGRPELDRDGRIRMRCDLGWVTSDVGGSPTLQMVDDAGANAGSLQPSGSAFGGSAMDLAALRN